ncbi:MAG: type II toxin-antitoxin system VapC family toxin [Gammaproteobacteria bacterium]
MYDWLMGEIDDQQTIDLIEAEEAYASAISVWEMAIKHALGKMALPSGRVAADIEAQGFRWLNVTPYHAENLIELPAHHKDPFDRLLIAQAKYESMRIVTYDGIFRNYLADAFIVTR